MLSAMLHLNKLVQDSQEYGSDDEFMVSRVFFDLEIEGNWHRGLYANIKQVVGSPISANALEVSPPIGYKGPFNQEAFSKAVANYFLRLIGPNGSVFSLGNSKNIRMQNNSMAVPENVGFIIDSPSGGW
jgi:hypothetical protein